MFIAATINRLLSIGQMENDDNVKIQLTKKGVCVIFRTFQIFQINKTY